MGDSSTEDILARAGIRIAGYVDSDDRSAAPAPLPEPEFKDTAPVGDLSAEMVSELVSAFCRDTRSIDCGVDCVIRAEVLFPVGVSRFHHLPKNFDMLC